MRFVKIYILIIMEIKTDLEQVSERLREIEKHLKSLTDKKENIEKLIHKKLFGISFLVSKNTSSLLYEQEELKNTILYLEDYHSILLKQQIKLAYQSIS